MESQHPSHASRGVIFVLLACVLWGTTGTAHSFAPEGMSAHWVGALRLVVAASFFIVLATIAPKAAAQPAQMPQTPSTQNRTLDRGLARAQAQSPSDGATATTAAALPSGQLLLCALCMVAYNLAFFDGLRRTGVGLGTAVAIGSSPVFAGLLSAALLKRWPARAWWLGTAIGIVGGALMALANHGDETGHLASGWDLMLGLALCLLAGLAYGSYAVLCQPLLARAGVARANAWVFATAALLSLPAAAGLGGALPAMDVRGWGVVVYLGVFATGLAYWFFSQGLRTISAATGVTLSKAEPIVAFVLAIVVLGEPVSAQAIVGLTLVLAGLALVMRAEMRSQ